MIEVRQYPLCEGLVERLQRKFNDGGWVTLSGKKMFSCLVGDEKVDECMEYDEWEVNAGTIRPCINESDGQFISYARYGEDYVEPIVLWTKTEGRWDAEAFLVDEFVMFYNLHRETKNKDKHEYVYYQMDECGNDVEVAMVEGINLVVKLKYVKEYIAAKQQNLLIFIDEDIYSKKSLTKLGLQPITPSVIKDTDIIFSYTLCDSSSWGVGNQSCATFRGKCVYRHNTNDIQHLWELGDSGFEDFIVGADDDGNEVYMTCDECHLPNPYFHQCNGPHTLTHIFFRREVLTAYFQSPEKYSVGDGSVEAPTWYMPIDIDRDDDYVVVPLVYLGKIPYKEQQHWKKFNILPPKDARLSPTSFKRWYKAEPTDCGIAPDLVFKKLYVELNDKWAQRYGWPLFKPLATDDQYHYDTLHLMCSEDDQKEFDDLVLSVTKVVIDSLDETHLVNAIDPTNPEVVQWLSDKDIEEHKPSKIKGGIAKLECFLLSEGEPNPDLIQLLRNIQNLRSCTVAHRKSTNLNKNDKKLFEYFGIPEMSDKEVFRRLLINLNEKLVWLQNN